ncbi:MAG: rod shape-determining protein MreC [Acidimicrobiia bacterium]
MVVYRREGRHRSVLLAIVISSLLLVTLDSRGNGVIDSVRTGVRDASAPVRSVVEDVFSPVRDLAGGLTDYGSLRDENAELRRRVTKLEGQISRDRAVGGKVGELERLLDLPTAEDATGIAARVVGSAAGNFERTVEINKGTSSGVFVGQPVVAGNGLVGRVTRVSRTLATVTLVDSPEIGVGVRLENTDVRGLTEAHTGEREVLLKFLEIFEPTGAPLPKCTESSSPDTCIAEGEFVFTASTDDAAFPPDIAVGIIESYTRATTDLEATIKIRPVVDLDDLTYVKVLRWPEPKTKTS